jgi:hypothetical protein
MDKKYLNQLFSDDIQKCVRNFIFELDKKLDDNDINKYNLDKEWDFLEISNFDYDNEFVSLDYRIISRISGVPKVFDEPVHIKIPIIHLIISNFKYFNEKIGK